MTRRTDGMVDVGLDDEPDPGAARAIDRAPGALREAAGPGPRQRQGRWSMPLVVVVILAVLTGGLAVAREQSLDRRGDQALVAAHSDVPGVVGSLRREPDGWAANGPVSSAAGAVLVREPVTTTERTVARDPRTGDRLWVAAATLTPAGNPLRCPATVQDGGLLLCEVDGRDGVASPTTDEVLGGVPDQLVLLDLATGDVLDLRVLGPGTVGWATTEQDVVLARRVGDGIVVERQGAVGRDPVWTRRLPLPPDVLARHLTLRLSDGLVAIEGPLAAVLEVVDGTVLGTWTAPPPTLVRITTGPLGFTVRAPGSTVWYDRSGAAGVAGGALTGTAVRPGVDDGSVAQVVLVQDGDSLLAVDVVGGTVRWSRAPVRAVHARLDRMLVVQDDVALRVVEVATGQEVWSVGLVEPAVSLVTDGVRVLVARSGTDVGTMTAYRLADGHPVWAAPLPIGTTGLVALDGVTLATGERVVVLG